MSAALPVSPSGTFAAALAAVAPLDDDAMVAAAARWDRLTKPQGALGRLEAIGIQLSGIAGASPPPDPAPAAVAVFAADHGVVAEGVTPWPQDVTAQMVANFVRGGAAINAFADLVGAHVVVVDVGVAGDLADLPGLVRRSVARGTADLVTGPAMTPEQVAAALDIGADVAGQLVDGGARCLVTGEMGIGNTTAAAALIAALSGHAAAQVTGRGTGVDDATLAHKVAVVERALARHATSGAEDPLAVLASLGGLEIAALTGFVVAGAARGVPVLVDGVIADAALLVAAALSPHVAPRCVAGHRSAEPGATVALRQLALEPVLDLGLRLGEGTGACLALPVVRAAARALRDMATFDDAGVSEA